MLRPIAILLILSLTFTGWNQTIDHRNIDLKFLEHIVKQKIDSVRTQHQCKPLINDSILFIAAEHHSKYMYKRGGITHNESEFEQWRTPQLRVDYYGGKNYAVGENVLMTDYNCTLKDKKGRKHNARTYQGLADAIVAGWVNSPGHYKNIITPEYQLTGVSLQVHPFDYKVYACQKFAKVSFNYDFKEYTTLFPYSDYTRPPVVNSFEGIPNQLLEHEHQWMLKHDELNECIECNITALSPPYISLRHDKGNYYLKVENSDYVKSLIKNRKDGFAVELVNFEDYMCGNPNYYTKASRRNGQCTLNGEVLQPLYRKDLYKGYKKRKTNKGVRFMPFIFGADSVKFFKRFYQYKLNRFTSEYFEIKLGRMPNDLKGGYYNHNLVYIQNKQVCHIDYFTDYKGELFSDTLHASFIPMPALQELKFVNDQKKMTFEIPFEVNKVDYSKADIQPFMDSLSMYKFSIDSIAIQAFASVEGDSIKNEKLQVQRAENIAKVLQEYANSEVPIRITSQEAWDHFNEAIQFHPKYKQLANQVHQKVKDVITGNQDPRLQQLLKQERKGIIDLYTTIEVTDENLWYFVQKAWNSRVKLLKDPQIAMDSKKDVLFQLSNIYEFIHKKVDDGLFPVRYLAQQKMPPFYTISGRLMEQYYMYGLEFKEEYEKNTEWKKVYQGIYYTLVEDVFDHTTPEFRMHYCTRTVEEYLKTNRYSKDKLEKLLETVQSLRPYYSTSKAMETNIDNIIFDINYMLVNKIYNGSSAENSDDARFSIMQLHQHYKKYNTLTDSIALHLGKLLVHYSDIEGALFVLLPHVSNNEILKYAIPLAYNHVSEYGSEFFYNWVFEAKSQLTNEEWCNMFILEYQIPFQAFDHEQLRNLFCDECVQTNEFIKQLFE